MARPTGDQLTPLFERAAPAMVELRHDLHRHPELSFDEYRTTGVIRARLEELGWELAACPTPTGAVAVLTGGRPGRRVMVRADIDGLPVTEERDLPFRSTVDGVMHACGHDVHTAALLGVADVLASRREDLAGEFTLVFQPAEEGLGGARAMIAGGLFIDHPVDAVIGAHVTSVAPVGLVATRAGTLMSSPRSLTIDIEGTGGHGAMATVEGNVILAASALAPRVGEVAHGLVFEGTECACSIGIIHAGTAVNVVPRRATLGGSLRTFTTAQRESAVERLRALLAEVAAEFGVSCSLSLNEGTSAVVNDAEVTRRVLASAERVVGSANVVSVSPVTPSDDVSEFLEQAPGCYLLIGGALADGTSGMHHSPDFAIDDDACRAVASVLGAAAVDLAQG